VVHGDNNWSLNSGPDVNQMIAFVAIENKPGAFKGACDLAIVECDDARHLLDRDTKTIERDHRRRGPASASTDKARFFKNGVKGSHP